MTPGEFHAWLTSPPPRRVLVMGVLNVTPDSFSDGGRFNSIEQAVARAREMVREGADLIDVGGESTRPGSRPVAADVQIGRVVPVLEALRRTAEGAAVSLSVDTTRAIVAEAALDAGGEMVNDVSAGRDDAAMLPLVARRGAAVVLMHMQATPATMQIDPRYDDVTREVVDFLRHRADAAAAAGVDRSRVLLDPGIGFGKTTAHNLELLRRLGELAALGPPLVVGTSRKGFIGKVTGVEDPSQRLFGTAATVAWAVANGAAVVRVHDVGPMSQVARMVRAIQTGKP